MSGISFRPHGNVHARVGKRPVSFKVDAFVQGGFPASTASPQVIWVSRDPRALSRIKLVNSVGNAPVKVSGMSRSFHGDMASWRVDEPWEFISFEGV